MHQLIQQHLAEIADICRRYRVQRLDVFGSAARGQDFDPKRSDADFLVEFQAMPNAGYARMYFELQEALERLVGRPVELITGAPAGTRTSGRPFRRAGSGSMDRDPRMYLWEAREAADHVASFVSGRSLDELGNDTP